ncbi:tryptophan-rich sensory protein [Paenibacillus sp. GYB003]|uniref:tryptophan-rich sensory protein n=1 Tax=Paenibacillus sp. GYB003 TaxID=2994392 RepID=UPI002F96ABC4
MWHSAIVWLVTIGLYALSVLLWPADRSWYAGLDKPAWTPPAGWSIAVWGVVYAAVAAAVTIVYSRSDAFQDIAPAWLTALAVNYGCSQLSRYFECKQKKLFPGFIASFAVAASACWLAVETVQYSKLAAWLIMPYLVWSCFQTLLPWSIFILNRDNAEA